MPLPRPLTLFAACVFSWAVTASAQNSPPLGDVARQSRADKQQQSQNNSTPASDPNNSSDGTTSPTGEQPKTSRVITNDDLPAHHAAAPPGPAAKNRTRLRPAVAYEIKHPAEYWKAQALQLKNSIAQVQRHIDTL